MRELLGGKGANVAEMTRILGADRVPAGFTITTEACVAYMRAGAFPDGKSRELSSDVVAAARLFVDRRESTLNEAGDYRIAAADRGFGPEHIVGELGEVLEGTVEGRRSDDELTLFKSMGIAVEDLAAAELCVARARERGIGVEVDF